MKAEHADLLNDIFIQPWFTPERTARKIRLLLPEAHHHKMRFFFEDYGCLRCGKKGVRYGSNAMCKPCVQSVKLKMLFAIKRRWKADNPTSAPKTFQRAATARKLLADLVSKK